MKPYFSIIIPVAPNRNCEVLESIKHLDFPKNQYEVIIERGTNPSRNRNNGAKKAKGKILAFIDDDAIVPKGLLKDAKNLFEINVLPSYFPFFSKFDILGGPQLTPPDDKWFAKACGEVLASTFGSLSMADRYRRGKENFNANENSLTSAVMFVRADAFKDIGGFNEKLFPGEDPEFLARAKKKGHRIAYSPNIFIWHRRRPTLLGYCEQMFSYGKVRLQKEKSAKSEGKKGLLFYVPMLFFIYIVLWLGLNSIPWFNIPIVAYFIIALFSSMGKGLKYLLVLPFLYALTHLAYGAGMTEGFLDRYVFNRRSK